MTRFIVQEHTGGEISHVSEAEGGVQDVSKPATKEAVTPTGGHRKRTASIVWCRFHRYDPVDCFLAEVLKDCEAR